jgi:hypothetical protein
MQSTTLFSVHLEHKNIIEPTWSNEPTSKPPISPLINELLQDQEEDKSVSYR